MNLLSNSMVEIAVKHNTFMIKVCNMFSQVLCVFFLYIWCAAVDPADPGVFKSKKYLRLYGSCKHRHVKESRQGVSDVGLQLEEAGEKKECQVAEASEKLMTQQKSSSCCSATFSALLIIFYHLSFVFSLCQSREWSSEQQDSEEGMFFCSLCEVEVCFFHLLVLMYDFLCKLYLTSCNFFL